MGSLPIRNDFARPAAAMPSFKGQAEYSVDSKGRVAIPAKMRANLRPEADGTFVLTRGFEQCIFLYPLDEWRRKEHEIAELNMYRSESRAFVRIIMMWAEEVSLDSQGRLSLPRPLIEFAGLDGRALILGSMDHIEIWSPDRFTQYLDDELDMDYEALTEKVMGI